MADLIERQDLIEYFKDKVCWVVCGQAPNETCIAPCDEMQCVMDAPAVEPKRTTVGTINKLVEALREHAEWAESNIYEVPIMLPDDLRAAADAITAAVEDLTSIAKKLNSPCDWCANYYSDVKLTICMMCDDEEHNGNFEWRGVRKEEE